MTSSIYWAMYNDELIIYPKAMTGTELELIGILKPANYTDADLNKVMVKVVTVGNEEVEVQGLSSRQLKLVRYKVISRLFDDVQNDKQADRFEAKAQRLEYNMKATHGDDGFTDDVGQVRQIDA